MPQAVICEQVCNGSELPLTGVSVVEMSSFVAVPLCSITLSQLGAQVIRIDLVSVALASTMLAADGTSIC
ncbi:CoA transferase [Mycobacterium uberis]|uniref:CoA transferase n=1 Tax=Mycobacterium uberis TaxID=2162698 RepID=UPI001FB3F82C|nr:CoA transferase [Mycobacterium uberis]